MGIIITMLLRVLFMTSLLYLTACGGGSSAQSQPDYGPEITGPLFTASPLDQSAISLVTGQGHLAPYPHTLPTPHVYLYWHAASPVTALLPVVAPGPGTITFVLNQGGDYKIMVRSSPTLTWYMDHIILAPGLGLQSVLKPGMAIGTTSTRSSAIDLGLLDSTVTNPFIAPQRYGADLLTCVSPWTRFTPELRSQFSALSNVIGPNKDGAVCFDKAGTVAGNWFLDGVPDSPDAYGRPENWPKQLAFVRDETDGRRWRISVGGTISPAALWAIADGDPEPTAMSSGPGTRIIRLYPNLAADGGMIPSGWLLVRLDAYERLYVEYISAIDHPPATAVDTPVTDFTGGQRLYRRTQGANG